MDYINALQVLHRVIVPRSYCEIGCRFGHSLSLARCPSVAIDPDFEIKAELLAPVRLFRMASDDFFARSDLGSILRPQPDLAFIDGMHNVEFALRDFINLEKNMGHSGVIAVDDVLPQAMEYATRVRATQIWTGDIYRLILVLRHYRPDLKIRIYDVEMKGLAVVSGLDPASTVLSDAYEQIEAELAAGKWSCQTVEAIRESLAPRPPAELETDFAGWSLRAEAGGLTPGGASATELYLDLLKRSILNEIYLDDELRILYLRDCLDGNDRFDFASLHDIRHARAADYEKLANSRKIGQFFGRNIHRSGFSHSMMGRMRLDSLHECLDIVRADSLAGDIVECGVWRGGGCIFSAGYLRAHEMNRRVYVADSFEGLPVPSAKEDQGLDLSKERFPELAVSMHTVRENFAAYGLDQPNVVFLKGWFKDTLPTAPVDMIALLRLDGDLYESTMDALNALYDKVVPGGVVIVDDYNALKVCRDAVHDFFGRRGEAVPNMITIDWTGVWFRKPGRPAAS